MTDINSYLYRLPRFGIDFAVEFVAESGPIAGRCKNLSDTGLFGRFVRPLGVDTTGTLRLFPANLIIEMTAQVTHSDGLDAGLHFDFASDQERQLIRALVKAASRAVTGSESA